MLNSFYLYICMRITETENLIMSLTELTKKRQTVCETSVMRHFKHYHYSYCIKHNISLDDFLYYYVKKNWNSIHQSNNGKSSKKKKKRYLAIILYFLRVPYIHIWGL